LEGGEGDSEGKIKKVDEIERGGKRGRRKLREKDRKREKNIC